MSDIKFGTDGWRGRIADDYTFENVRRCAHGYATDCLAKPNAKEQKPVVVIGHDKRFQSEDFAAAAAEVLAGNGIKVWLTDGATPTPVIAFAVKAQKALGAINITASHNPPQDNGFKVRDYTGGAIDPRAHSIEGSIPASSDGIASMGYAEAVKKGHDRQVRRRRQITSRTCKTPGRSGADQEGRAQSAGGSDVGQWRGLVARA